MRELSVFCDESGDFGPYDHRSPFYLLTLVFHDQSVDIQREIPFLERAISHSGYPSGHTVHTGPLIRREGEYGSADIEVRRKLFDAIFAFFRHCDISYRAFVISKKEFGSGDDLAGRIARVMGEFIRDNLGFFQSYDRIVIYYDKGQKEITRTLKIIFMANLENIEFMVVHPEDYRLFQVADLVCTLELLALKRKRGVLSGSEKLFFKNAKRLKNTYLRYLERKGFAG